MFTPCCPRAGPTGGEVDTLAMSPDSLAIRLGDELRKAARRDEGVEVGRAHEKVAELLHGQREVVVGIEGAAVDLAPSSFTSEAIAGRRRRLTVGKRISQPLHALVVVGGRRSAGLDAERAALGLELEQRSRLFDADAAVFGADVGPT